MPLCVKYVNASDAPNSNGRDMRWKESNHSKRWQNIFRPFGALHISENRKFGQKHEEHAFLLVMTEDSTSRREARGKRGAFFRLRPRTRKHLVAIKNETVSD